MTPTARLLELLARADDESVSEAIRLRALYPDAWAEARWIRAGSDLTPAQWLACSRVARVRPATSALEVA